MFFSYKTEFSRDFMKKEEPPAQNEGKQQRGRVTHSLSRCPTKSGACLPMLVLESAFQCKRPRADLFPVVAASVIIGETNCFSKLSYVSPYCILLHIYVTEKLASRDFILIRFKALGLSSQYDDYLKTI